VRPTIIGAGVAGCLALSLAFVTSGEVAEAQAAAAVAAYCDGAELSLSPVPPAAPAQEFLVGPWRYGERVVSPRPSDRRPNLYLVAPGVQHQNARVPRYDHNAVINLVPASDAPVEWDVYWAIVLDPRLRHDFRSERDLLLAAQAGFDPGDLYELEDAPGRGWLALVNITSAAQLERFRRKDGKLPRLLILPAGFAIRARASEGKARPQ